ncbi:9977_t:CDS:2, partial [Dentiscutata erythropus]
MKKYAAAKGHGVQIGDGERKNAETQQIMKQMYLCRHSGKHKTKWNVLSSRMSMEITAKADTTMQYKIIQEKFKIRIHRPDLYNIINVFRHDSTPGKKDTITLLKRLYKKKIKDPRWLHYYNVVMHNNTYKTNCYDWSLSIFIIPNNNLKTRIVAQAIVNDKTQSLYEWASNALRLQQAQSQE